MKIKSSIPGRIRVVENKLKTQYKLSALLELSLMQISGIKNVRINPVNASIKVIYNVHKIERNEILSSIEKYIDNNDLTFSQEIFEDYTREKKNLTHAGNNLITFGLSYILVKIKKYFFGNFYFASSLPVLVIAALVTIISDYPLLSVIRKKINNKFDNFFIYLGLLLTFLREGDLTLFLLFIKSCTEVFNAYSGLQVQKQYIKNCSIGRQVEKINENGKKITLPVSAVKPGDEILITENNVIRFNGDIIEGRALVNHVYYRGRCIIDRLQKNDKVQQGMFVVQGKIKVRVTEKKEYGPKNDIELREMPIYSKANNYQKKQLKYATLFAFLGFVTTGSFITPLSVYLVMGPAAVDFAVKSGLALYLKKLRNKGIILRNVKKIEKIRDVDIIVFDKTGTLTSDMLIINEIKVKDSNYNENEVMKIFANCENGIIHPIAASVDKEDDNIIKEKEYISGRGVRALYQGEEVLVGNLKLMNSQNIEVNENENEEKGIKVFIAADGNLIAELSLVEEINKTASTMFKQLDKLKIERAIISGDDEKNLRYTANSLNISRYKGNMSYDDKQKYIKELKNNYNNIIMVGDGINDTAAMEEADISITFRRESVNLEKVWQNADCILREDDLTLIVDLILLSRSTGRQIVLSNNLCRTNNIVFGLLTVFGYYNPFQAKAINTLNSIMAFLCNLPIIKLNKKGAAL